MNQLFRKVIFWLHLSTGVAAGAVILIMSATGALLTYERQITEWADRGFRVAPPAASTARLPVETLVSRAAAARPGPPPTSLTVQSDPAAPVLVNLGRESSLYLNGYSGEVLGQGSPKVRAFFHAVTDWHRWLGAGGEKRAIGRAVTGACNLAFLVLVLSGLYLWLPRKWSWRQVRNVAWFRRGLGGKARDFNWHNVLGVWSWLPLVLIVSTGVVMSYPWANALLFRLAGEEPPARREAGGPQREGRERRGEAPELNLEGLDDLWAVAERRVEGWRSITLRLPDSADAPVTFSIYRGDRGRPDLRSQLALDRRSGEVVTWEPFSSQGPGRRLRSWARWVHTGEAGGLIGQTVAGLISLAVTVLVWTGCALAWRRMAPRRRARESRLEEGESLVGEIR